jgi:penicillin-binding protein 2
MKDSFINRKYVIMALLCLLYLGLLVRLFIIQVIKNSYRISADNNVLRYVTQYPARGLIYDRNGKLIVFNQAAYDLMVVPAQTTAIDTTGFCTCLEFQEICSENNESCYKLFKKRPVCIPETDFK